MNPMQLLLSFVEKKNKKRAKVIKRKKKQNDAKTAKIIIGVSIHGVNMDVQTHLSTALVGLLPLLLALHHCRVSPSLASRKYKKEEMSKDKGVALQ